MIETLNALSNGRFIDRLIHGDLPAYDISTANILATENIRFERHFAYKAIQYGKVTPATDSQYYELALNIPDGRDVYIIASIENTDDSETSDFIHSIDYEDGVELPTFTGDIELRIENQRGSQHGYLIRSHLQTGVLRALEKIDVTGKRDTLVNLEETDAIFVNTPTPEQQRHIQEVRQEALQVVKEAIVFHHSFPFKKVVQLMKRTDEEVIPREQKGDIWAEDFIGNHAIGKPDSGFSYDENFETVLGYPVIEPFLENRRHRGLSTTVIDLGGGNGMAVRQLKQRGLLQHGLTINLTEMRTPEERTYDHDHGLDLITGNLFRSDSWRAIDRWLANNTETGYADLIMTRPGGAYRIDAPREAYHIMLKRIIGRTNYQGGLFVGTVPYNIDSNKSWTYRKEKKYVPEMITTIPPRPSTNEYFHELHEYPGLSVTFKKDHTHWRLSGMRTWYCGVLKIALHAEEPFTIH